MNKKDLIDKLEPYPDDMEVVFLEDGNKQADIFDDVGMGFAHEDNLFLDINALLRLGIENARHVIVLGWSGGDIDGEDETEV